ncbi:MAG TPA: hypothetical protein VFE62_12980 [Gemmataceae bacterium]|nr:hypothetical protein [Gemmataceae bacterium]
MAVFDGCVDLNRHQIHAAAFDLRNPGSKGMVLADEIGLEKTTKPGWHRASMAERQWLLFVTCPASLWKERSPKHEETVQRLMFDVEDV